MEGCQEKVNNGNERPIITVIIPVYNTAPYLKDSISSVLKQTFFSFEVILINDGSSDDSQEICEMACRKDNRVCLLNCEEHKGVSYARNLGIESAKGKYLCFLDSDDRLHPMALECMWKEAEKTHADLIMADHWISDTLSQKSWDRLCKRTLDPSWELCKGEQIWGTRFAWGQCGTVWAKLFLREAVSDMRFEEDVNRSEDWLFNFQFLTKKSPLLAATDCKAYFHEERPEGLSHQATIDELLASIKVKRYIREQELEAGRKESAVWAEKKIIACVRDWLLMNPQKTAADREKLLTFIDEERAANPLFKELSFYQKLLLFLCLNVLPLYHGLKVGRDHMLRFLNSLRSFT